MLRHKLLTLLLVSLVLVDAEYKFETKWFEVPLDHFSYQRDETFKIKYLVNDTYWDKGNGPIFFYTGNEGQIEVFTQHAGFMWEIAQEFNAKLVFAEHRYYGASLPFGNKSLEKEHIGYLTTSQALADYADLVNFLQGDEIKPQYPVIAFGGSYGGMLSAYFRMKYPHIVAGSIAASAPVHMFPGMAPCEAYHRIVTSSYNIANTNCVDNIRLGWATIRNFTKSANETAWLEKEWNLCQHVKNESDVNTLVGFVQFVFETVAMVNYPFPSDFLRPLPAHPVRVACQHLADPLKEKELLTAIGKVLDMYTNYDHKSKCMDYQSGMNYGNLDAAGWDFQACTEMIMPMCTTGQYDMFEPSPWNFTDFSEECHKKFGVYPRPEVARIEYGGDRLQAASNIVFSNGLLDPWAGGGILNSISDSVKAVVIINAAHHLDLMPQNEADTEPVKMARECHKKNIRRWIRQFHGQPVDANDYKC